MVKSLGEIHDKCDVRSHGEIYKCDGLVKWENSWYVWWLSHMV